MLSGMFASYGIWDYVTTFLDIGIVAFVIYKLLFLVRGTRAVQLIKGIVVLLAAAVVSNLLDLTVMQWLLDLLPDYSDQFAWDSHPNSLFMITHALNKVIFNYTLIV